MDILTHFSTGRRYVLLVGFIPRSGIPESTYICSALTAKGDTFSQKWGQGTTHFIDGESTACVVRGLARVSGAWSSVWRKSDESC